MNTHIWTKSKFYGMSIGVVNVGEGKVFLKVFRRYSEVKCTVTELKIFWKLRCVRNIIQTNKTMANYLTEAVNRTQ